MATGKYLATRFNQHFPLKYAYLPVSRRLPIYRYWETGVRGRLPRHYVAFHNEWNKGPLTPIHYRPSPGRFTKDEFGQVIKIQNPKLPVLYPDEFHEGLWGGEGLVKGFQEPPPTKHNPNYKPAQETYYWPKLYQGVVYSEVLDKHLEVIMTARAQRLIDENFGLDNYLLKTPVNEIYSWLGLKIKREILLSLAKFLERGSDEKLLAKYESHILPFEEADWHGLTMGEAIHKQLILDRIEDEAQVVPLKEVYRKELFEKLSQGLSDEIDPDLVHPVKKESLLTTFFKSPSDSRIPKIKE